MEDTHRGKKTSRCIKTLIVVPWSLLVAHEGGRKSYKGWFSAVRLTGGLCARAVLRDTVMLYHKV